MKLYNHGSWVSQIIVLIVISSLSQSCSLLKISADIGMEPLTNTQLNQRLSVRLYCTNFTEFIIKAADTIYIMSADPMVKLNSIRWKANSTGACLSTSLHSIPESALLNTWVFLYGMNEFMATDTSFADLQYVPQIASEKLLEKFERIPRMYLKPNKYRLMNSFVDSVVIANPYTSDYITKDYTSDWLRYAGIPDSIYIATYGSISETIGDISDKTTFYMGNAANQLDWTFEKAQLMIDEGLIDSTSMARIDSLEVTLVALRHFMEHTPEVVDGFSDDMAVELEKVMNSLQQTVNISLTAFANERMMIEGYLTKERKAILSEAQDIADSSIKNISEAIPRMIKSILIYVILGLAILLGLPFFFGFLLGKYKPKKNNQR